MAANADSLSLLAGEQLKIIDRHFGDDGAAQQSAFEAFGQGVLFDDRRPAGDKVHKMDTGGPADPPTGYHNWHAFIRAAVLVGGDPQRWLEIDRQVGLAWGIQSVAKPVEDATNNPPLQATHARSGCATRGSHSTPTSSTRRLTASPSHPTASSRSGGQRSWQSSERT